MSSIYKYSFSLLISIILLTSVVKAETITLEDFLFDINNLKGKEGLVDTYFGISKNPGDAYGRMHSDTGDITFNVQLKLKGEEFKDSWKRCKKLALQLGENSFSNIYFGNYYYCGYTRLHLEVIVPMQMGVNVKGITFLKDN